MFQWARLSKYSGHVNLTNTKRLTRAGALGTWPRWKSIIFFKCQNRFLKFVTILLFIFMFTLILLKFRVNNYLLLFTNFFFTHGSTEITTQLLFDFCRKFRFWIFHQNFDFWRKSRFFTEIPILTKITIFHRNFDFDENLDFSPKFWFLTKITIFHRNFDFWSKSRFFTDFWREIRFLTKISILDQNFDFW